MFGLNEITGKSFFKNKDKLMVSTMFFTLQGEGPLMGRPALFVRLSKCNLGCSWCFLGNTKVLTSKSGINQNDFRIFESDIRDIDYVVSFNPSGANVTFNYNDMVLDTHKRVTHQILKIQTKYNAVFTAEEHPFLIKDDFGYNYKQAKDLQVDDIIYLIEIKRYVYNTSDIIKSNNIKESLLQPSKITSIDVMSEIENTKEWRESGGTSLGIEVYDLTVENNHTFFANSFAVHNCDAFYEEGDWFTPEEIIQRAHKIIDDYFNGNPPDCYKFIDKRDIAFIVTGGEPTLQNNLLYELLTLAGDEYRYTQIESNGILEPKVPDSTIVVVSPKCKEDVKDEDGFKRFIPKEYMKPNKKTLKRANALKFVMEHPDNLKTPYNSIPSWAFEWKGEGKDIYCSPMCIYNREPQKAAEVRKNKTSGRLSNNERVESDEVVSFWEEGLIDMFAFQKNHEWASKYAIENGCRFQMQMHLFANLA